MPSFDVVCELDMHEISNAVDQANREVTTRFDFKDTGAKFELKEDAIELNAQQDFQLKQMQDVLASKLTKRDVSIKHLDYKDPEVQLNKATQRCVLKKGIDQDSAKKIVKQIKEEKLKVQASIQGDQVRVTGKKRDDLQETIAVLKEKVDLPVQFVNFRD